MSSRCILACFVNFILKIAMTLGTAIIVLGYLNTVAHVHDGKVSQFFLVLGITLIVIGSTVVVLALIGILGSCLQNKCLLNTFSTLLIILLVGQFVAVLIIFSFYNQEMLAEELKSSMQYYNDDKDIKTFWDLINTKLECCGIDSVSDWHDNIPNSCCKDLNINDDCHRELANEKLCMPEIVNILTKKLPIGLTIIGGIQVFCLVASFSMSRTRRANV